MLIFRREAASGLPRATLSKNLNPRDGTMFLCVGYFPKVRHESGIDKVPNGVRECRTVDSFNRFHQSSHTCEILHGHGHWVTRTVRELRVVVLYLHPNPLPASGAPRLGKHLSHGRGDALEPIGVPKRVQPHLVSLPQPRGRGARILPCARPLEGRRIWSGAGSRRSGRWSGGMSARSRRWSGGRGGSGSV